jgi:DNA-binding response OmpR family regulator
MLRILVVDDEPSTLTLLEALLRKEGYLVQTAADGKSALEKADAMAPDVLVTDVEMPGLSGNQLIASVRANGRLRDTYVIVFTAHGEKTDKMKSLLSGADDFIVKPGSPPEILARLEIAGRVRRIRKDALEAQRRAAHPDAASVAAIEAVLGNVRGLLLDAERALGTPEPATARAPLHDARATLEKVLQALREDVAG